MASSRSCVMKSMVTSTLVPDLEQVRLHAAARLRVERAERLVHEQDARLVRERARDGHALLHAAGELRRVVRRRSRRGRRARATRSALAFGAWPGPMPFIFEPEHHVLLDREPRETACSSGRPCRDRRRGRRPACRRAAPRRELGLVEPGEDADQRRLAAAGRADHADELARAHLEARSSDERHDAARCRRRSSRAQAVDELSTTGALRSSAMRARDLGGVVADSSEARGDRRMVMGFFHVDSDGAGERAAGPAAHARRPRARRTKRGVAALPREQVAPERARAAGR